MDDRRREARKRVLMAGRIIFNSRSSVVDCTVRDLTANGALISFAEALKIPPEVELEIPKTGQWFRAHVVRSFGHSHGLMFINEPMPKYTDAPPQVHHSAPSQPAVTEALPSDIHAVIEEARHRIAQMAGVSPAAIRLKLEIDY